MRARNKLLTLFVMLVLIAASFQVAHVQSPPTIIFPNVHSFLSTSITSGSTSLTLDNGIAFAEPPAAMLIDSELILYQTKTGNTFSGLVRGARGTTPASHVANTAARSSTDALNIGAATVDNTKFGYLANLTGDIQAQLDAKAPATTTSLYNALTLQNSWTNLGGAFGTASYSKMGNLVCLQGLITGGADNTVAFTMPAGARPNASVIITTRAETTNARITITTAGVTTVNEYSATWLSLSGVCYVVP